jgi:hypothetical protein
VPSKVDVQNREMNQPSNDAKKSQRSAIAIAIAIVTKKFA